MIFSNYKIKVFLTLLFLAGNIVFYRLQIKPDNTQVSLFSFFIILAIWFRELKSFYKNDIESVPNSKIKKIIFWLVLILSYALVSWSTREGWFENYKPCAEEDYKCQERLQDQADIYDEVDEYGRY